MILDIFRDLDKWTMHLFSDYDDSYQYNGSGLAIFFLCLAGILVILWLIVYGIYEWLDLKYADHCEYIGKVLDKKYVGEYNSTGTTTMVVPNSNGGLGVGVGSTNSHSDEQFLLFIINSEVIYKSHVGMSKYYCCEIGQKIRFEVVKGRYSKKQLEVNVL